MFTYILLVLITGYLLYRVDLADTGKFTVNDAVAVATLAILLPIGLFILGIEFFKRHGSYVLKEVKKDD